MSLILDLVRHGEALAAGHGGDAARALSPRGRAEIAFLAERLRADRTTFTRVLVSPLARARETASILLGGRDGRPVPEIVAALVPDGEPDEVLAAIAAEGAGESHLLIVSHQPLIGRLAAGLSGEAVDFHPGTWVRIEFDGPPAPRTGRILRNIHPGR